MTTTFFILAAAILLFILFAIRMESSANVDSEWWKKVPADKWRWYGYYNKDDKRLFIWGRRLGIGWSINNANPYAILVYGGIILFLCLVIIFIK
jgi:uncharacterized membrane protein